MDWLTKAIAVTNLGMGPILTGIKVVHAVRMSAAYSVFVTAPIIGVLLPIRGYPRLD